MKTVLVIDDDDELLEALQRAHSAHAPEWELVALADSREAVALVEEGDVALVVTDILMPEVEGLELIRALQRASPQTPVLAMTGHARLVGSERLHAALALGAREVLEKPFDFERLARSVEEHLV